MARGWESPADVPLPRNYVLGCMLDVDLLAGMWEHPNSVWHEPLVQRMSLPTQLVLLSTHFLEDLQNKEEGTHTPSTPQVLRADDFSMCHVTHQQFQP